jgi:hypothetical protein
MRTSLAFGLIDLNHQINVHNKPHNLTGESLKENAKCGQKNKDRECISITFSEAN